MRSLMAMMIGVILLSGFWGCGNRHQVAVRKDHSKLDNGIDPFAEEVIAQIDPALLKPEEANETAPDQFRVKVDSTAGEFVIDVTRDWSPVGADRFYNLVKIGFYEDIAIFRAINGFMFQFGIHGQPAVARAWANARIQDDPPKGITNSAATVTFAKTGAPNSRGTQIFINLADNGGLDADGFTPFGIVTDGNGVLDQINTEYGENGHEVQPFLQSRGNGYIREQFPNADFIRSMKILPADD